MLNSRQDAKTLKSVKKPGCIYAAVFFTLISLPSFAEQPTSKESALSGRPEGTERSAIDSRKAAPKGGNRWGASTQAQDSGRPEEVQAQDSGRRSEGEAFKRRASSIRPNILWIFSEDNSSYLGCYGDKTARTPELDALAAKGTRYTHCYSNAPVCAVARSSIILGVPAVSTGTQHMRSKYKVPSHLTPYPTLLKAAGYHTINQVKTDYNTSSFDKNIWDQCKGAADFSRRDKGQPFFLKINFSQSHESGLFPEKRFKKLTTKAEDITAIPPYQIDNAETRADWQALYDKLEATDRSIGQLLKRLEKMGEAENTIVIYCSDHGGITIRSKRYLYDSGTRVPFIVYFPEKWQHLAPEGYTPGATSNRLTQFIDITKTILALAGADLPAHLSGRILAGDKAEPAREKIFLFSDRFDSAPDMSRALTDGRYKYIRNYEPDRRAHQLLQYPLQQKAQVAHFRAFQNGLTNKAQSAIFEPHQPKEFYDTQADPHEINNLINATDQQERIATFSQALDQRILETNDLGFIPEPKIEEVDQSGLSIYDWARQGNNYPLKDILTLANLVSAQNPDNIATFQQKLTDPNAIIRYWAALGLRVLREKAAPAQEALLKATTDSDASVRITAHMALGNIDKPDQHAVALLKEASTSKHDIHANWALCGVKYLEFKNIKGHYQQKELTRGPYSQRSCHDLFLGKTFTQLPE